MLGGLLIANLVGQCLIVLTGGLVRLTGSGLGCSTWPGCEPGQFVPVAPESYHPLVEFTNRGVGILLGLTAIALFLAAFRWARQRPGLLWATATIAVLTGAQGGIGAISVYTHLEPMIVQSHFTLSMVLVAVSTYALHRYREGDGPVIAVVSPAVRWLGVAAVAALAVVIVLGTVVTGSGPHSGDINTPNRLGFDVETVSRVHATSVWVFVALLALVLVGLYRTTAAAPGARARRAWWVLVALTVVQGVVGYVQYALGVPVALVAVHMVLATVMTLAGTRALLTLRVRD